MLLSNNLDLGFLQIGHSWSCSCNQASKTITLMHFYFWKSLFISSSENNYNPWITCKICTMFDDILDFLQPKLPSTSWCTSFHLFFFCSNLFSFSPVTSISAFYCLSHVLQGQYNRDWAQCYTRVVKSCTSTVRHAGSSKATHFQYSYWTAPAITCHQIEIFSSEYRDSKMIFYFTLPWFQLLHLRHQRLQCRRMTRGKKSLQHNSL